MLSCRARVVWASDRPGQCAQIRDLVGLWLAACEPDLEVIAADTSQVAEAVLRHDLEADPSARHSTLKSMAVDRACDGKRWASRNLQQPWGSGQLPCRLVDVATRPQGHPVPARPLEAV